MEQQQWQKCQAEAPGAGEAVVWEAVVGKVVVGEGAVDEEDMEEEAKKKKSLEQMVTAAAVHACEQPSSKMNLTRCGQRGRLRGTRGMNTLRGPRREETWKGEMTMRKMTMSDG